MNPRARVAILGGGISGLGAALELQDAFDVTVFEGSERAGGHIYPVAISDGPRTLHLDTGFLGYTPATYPKLTALFKRLGVVSATARFRVSFWDRSSDFSFPLYDFPKLCGKRFAIEAGRDLRRLIALLTKVAESPESLRADPRTVFEYLGQQRYHADLLDSLVLPALTVVWGFQAREIAAMSAYAALSLLRRTIFVDSDTEFLRVAPSSRAYLEALLSKLRCPVRVQEPVRRVKVEDTAVEVRGDGYTERFDAAIMAMPAWCALEALANPTDQQLQLLRPLQPNYTLAVVHRDTRIVPDERRGEGAFLVSRWGTPAEPILTATWDLARFQEYEASRPLLVTMGDERMLDGRHIDPALIDRVVRHRHVAMTPAYAKTEGMGTKLDNGRLAFSGSYMGPVGSHECAYGSALDAAARLRARLGQPGCDASPV